MKKNAKAKQKSKASHSCANCANKVNLEEEN